MGSTFRAGLGAALLCGACLLGVPAPLEAQPRPGFTKKNGVARRPGARLDALERMTPQQQDRFIESLPEQRRAQAREMLLKWRDMTPRERAIARRTLGEFRDLPPERQRRIRILYGEFNSLPAERQPVMRRELKALRELDLTARRARLDSEGFRNKFSPVERKLLGDLSEALPAIDAPVDLEEPEDQQE